MRINKTYEEIVKDINRYCLNLGTTKYDDNMFDISTALDEIFIRIVDGRVLMLKYNNDSFDEHVYEQYERTITFILENWIKL